jgi:RNA polymerase sigma-70 factor (ECF subfamily)
LVFLNNSNLELFEILFRQCYDKLYRVAYSITRDNELSKDAVQQAFLQAYKKLNQLKDKGKFPAWVTAITVNEAKNLVKTATRFKVIPMTDEIQTTNIDSFEHDYLIKDQVTRVLNTLSLDDAEILVLRYYSDLTLEEIATILKISLSNVKVRLHRAKTNFKQIITIHDDSADVRLGGIGNE